MALIERRFSCFDTHDNDLRDELYERHHVFAAGHILSRHFCRSVSRPPRRVIYENYADGFKLLIGLDYNW